VMPNRAARISAAAAAAAMLVVVSANGIIGNGHMTD